jgi:hypothetical protein
MAAGLGFKDFTTGEVLTAADVDGYLMQGVWVFASAAARDASVTSPQEGNFAYLKDTNVTTYYTGSAWANLDTTGMTNPMTTTGDTIYSSSGSTPARLGIGTTGQVLTVAGGVPSWATPAGGGGKVLQVIQATTSTSTTIASDTFTDTTLTATITPSSATSKILVLVQQSLYTNRSGASNTQLSQGCSLQLLRGASSVYDFGSGNGAKSFGLGMTSATISYIQQKDQIPLIYLDSPSTTSSTTYKTQAKVTQTSLSGEVIAQEGSTKSSITLLEIGA